MDSLFVDFYRRPVLQVARDLLGMRLVRIIEGQRLSGIIVEAEAYDGEQDLACHAHHGRTPRTAVMYGPPGKAYVYFTYGMHWMLNCVCGDEGYPAAVLLRAIAPREGLEQMKSHRAGRPPSEWCNGPAKICQAMRIDGRFNGADLSDAQAELRIEVGEDIGDDKITTGPRVGIQGVPEPWLSIPWRLQVKNLALLPDL
jgi:DNA-3-methyladenine glycosylase